MAQSSQSTEKAHWNEHEVRALVDYLYEHRAEAGDGGYYKAATYDAAAGGIAFHLSKGPTKTGKMCKTKWTSLKQLYTAIETYRNQPGFHWDSKNGAGIEGDAAAAVWTTYTQQKSNIVLRPYRNCGWDHYGKLQAIISTIHEQGTHPFRPSPAAPPLDDNEPDRVVPGKGKSLGSLMTTRGPAGDSGSGRANAGNSAFDDDKDTMHPTATSGSISINSGKREFSVVSDQDKTTTPKGSGVDTPSNSSSGRKKQSKSSSKSSTRASTSSIGMATEITPAVAIVGMQWSINRFVDVLERYMTPPVDATVSSRSRALQLLQEVDDGLSVKEKVAMISHFTHNAAAVDTYLSLTDADVRQSWIREMLASG